jgi:hypothetical protein
MKASKANRITIANPIPQNRNLFLWLSGSLSARMEIKMMLSIPRITSSAINDNKGIKASIILFVLEIYFKSKV